MEISIMGKRAALAVSSLALAAVLLLNFQGPGVADTATTTGSSASKVASVGSTTANSGTTATPPGSSGTSGSSSTAAATASPTPGAATGTAATVTGSLVAMRYGNVQVQITVQNGQITDVQALALPTGGHSGRISDIVGPMLRSEALSAQSASINVISGATYTSEAYATSLQAAIDAAGL